MTLLPGVSMQAALVTTSTKDDIGFILKKLGISTHQLAAMLGVNQSQIVRWKSGKWNPRAFNAIRLHEQARRLREHS